MSAILKDEEFVAVEAAVKAGVAPQPVAAAFNELSALRAELKKLGEPESYYLKAMNCPHHHRIFAAEPHSYRDLPLRLAEYGTCYRYEQSGELFNPLFPHLRSGHPLFQRPSPQKQIPSNVNDCRGGRQVITFDPVEGRWIRMHGIKRGTEWGYSIWEMRVFAK